MKEMIYKKTKMEKEILDEGTVNGYRYKIISYGSHPCAYVETHADVINYDDIRCRGEITFFEDLFPKDYIFNDRKHIVIGWDYNHFDDFNSFLGNLGNYGKKWTTEEIYNEVCEVIEQLKELEK